MHLTRFTDHAFRILYYLALKPGERVAIREIGDAFGISRNHLVKVVRVLVAQGWVRTMRGRSGGVTLAVDPAHIPLGEVVAACEPDFRLAECFDGTNNGCVIDPLCALKGILESGLRAFFTELNRHTVADLLVDREGLLGLLDPETKSGSRPAEPPADPPARSPRTEGASPDGEGRSPHDDRVPRP